MRRFAPTLTSLVALLLAGCGLTLDPDPPTPQLEAGAPLDAGRRDAKPHTDGAMGDGGPGADAGQPDAAVCDPSSEPTCMGDTLTRCTRDGTLAERTCLLGCEDGRCKRLSPSNVEATVIPDRADAELELDPDTRPPFIRFDTGTGRIVASEGPDSLAPEIMVRPEGQGVKEGIGFRRLEQDGTCAPKLGVFVLKSLRVRDGMRVYGTGPNALVLIARDEARINGRLSVGADLFGARRSGAGGAPGGNTNDPSGKGCGGGTRGPNTLEADGGGGGGSFGSRGGEGGTLNASPGGTYGTPALQPLTAGSGGGHGGSLEVGGPGGHGGGALQLTALKRIRVGGAARIDAAGGGGLGSRASSSPDSGGGGGSGGGILLEAPRVEIAAEARIGANGGAGGQGGPFDNEPGRDGRAGYVWESIPAPESDTVGRGGGGGHGSNLTAEASNGGGGDTVNGGGGGGGAGRIRINAARRTVEDGVILSPKPATELTTFGEL